MIECCLLFSAYCLPPPSVTTCQTGTPSLFGIAGTTCFSRATLTVIPFAQIVPTDDQSRWLAFGTEERSCEFDPRSCYSVW